MSFFNTFGKGSTFKSIAAKLRFSFSITTLLLCMIIALFFWFDRQETRLESALESLYATTLKVERASNIEKDFFIEEAINSTFYETRKSKYIAQHKQLLQEIRQELVNIQDVYGYMMEDRESSGIDSLVTQLHLFESKFDTLSQIMLKRGFKNYGLEGDMRKAMGVISNAGYPISETVILSIRRHEKDYMLRKDETYIGLLLGETDKLSKEIARKVSDPDAQALLRNSLEKYKSNFLALVEADKAIGFKGHSGLREELAQLSGNIEANMLRMGDIIESYASKGRSDIESWIIFLSIGFVAVNFLLSVVTTRGLSVPVEALSQSIKDAVSRNFEPGTAIYQSPRRDEIGQLSADTSLMLSRMQERTAEVIKQKEQVAEAYKSVERLGVLGRELAATLVIDEIIGHAFGHLIELMDVSIFWVGIINQEGTALEYRGGVLSQNAPNKFTQALSQKDKLGVWCFQNQKEAIIHDWDAENKNNGFYKRFTSVSGEWMQSIVYLPLSSANNKRIGVMGVQHEQKNAFASDYQLNILRNFASYLVVALDNALIYERLEETVKERTLEVSQQKEQLELKKTQLENSFNNIKLLSDIGRTLAGYLSIEAIVGKVYEQVNTLMDAVVFGIGIYREDKQLIEFPFSIEDGKRLPTYSYKMSETDSLAVRCFLQNEDLVINDLKAEHSHENGALAKHFALEQGMPQSMIYLPLLAKGKAMGVIAVQSMKANAYNQQHVYFLRNIGIYAAIALENARSYQQIEAQKEELNKSSMKITASINYAKRIQDALLPNMNRVRALLPQSFVMLKPRDIVSGDFFWFSASNERIYIAVLDCTGHGVPGAFMSMIGNELLNEAVIGTKLTEPEEILYHIHKGIRRDLRQYETDNRDGMDMSICVIDLQQKQLSFAGAKSPLVYVRDNELTFIPGDMYPIGGEQREKRRTFTKHILSLDGNTCFYLFSDGFHDQFGGEDGRKFMKKNFKKLLFDVHQKSMIEQEETLEGVFNTWTRGYKQIDDVLVVGFKL